MRARTPMKQPAVLSTTVTSRSTGGFLAGERGLEHDGTLEQSALLLELVLKLLQHLLRIIARLPHGLGPCLVGGLRRLAPKLDFGGPKLGELAVGLAHIFLALDRVL